MNHIAKIYDEKYIKNFKEQQYNKNYLSCQFEYKNKNYCFRECKFTPKKPGHFVSLWKKINNINEPFTENDIFDYYLFYVKYKNQEGYFKFPKQIMVKHDILQNNNVDGKLGFRLYAPWFENLNKTAIETQILQAPYFKEI